MNPYSRAPHAGPDQHPAASNAALLIDFDNVTMGMRSDLAKELKHLLDSDVIKGKVTVQRAYADWRRYPQYIVPLSEASIDLIFAPAYGSSKKNATDIRMAIDGMELVFIRPEIGTFILLTGDSDFSSLVLKLKEYGKYVIGIGIQESSSDILVQNCHEYYSYTSVTGLSKTSEGRRRQDGLDPWQVASDAVARMVARGDAMRSDRLKQVMMEISPGFDERNLGYGKFSKFVAEAAKKGLLHIERRENGQYEVAPPKREGGGRPAAVPAAAGKGPAAGKNSAAGKGSGPGRGVAAGKVSAASTGAAAGKASAASTSSAEGKATAAGTSSAAGAPNGQGPRRKDRKGAARESAPVAGEGKAADAPVVAETEAGKDRSAALQLLQRALREFGEKAEQGVRDSDVKRKLIALDADFDEGRLGFGKFSKFLLFAETHGVVAARRLEGGSFEVRVPPPAELDAKALGLPTSVESIKSYLTNRYKGIGAKTADKLIAAFGTKVFNVLQDEPERVRDVLPKARAVRVLAAWEDDHQRRSKLARGSVGASPRGADSPGGSGRTDAKPASRDAPAPTDRKPGRRTERKPDLPTDRKPGPPMDREPALAAKPGVRTVHEPRVRHFGRGRTGAKADSGRFGVGSRGEARPAPHAAGAKTDSGRSGVGAAASNVDSPAGAAVAPTATVATAATAAPPTDGAQAAVSPEADAPAPRKRASGVLGFLKRRGRGRVADGE